MDGILVKINYKLLRFLSNDQIQDEFKSLVSRPLPFSQGTASEVMKWLNELQLGLNFRLLFYLLEEFPRPKGPNYRRYFLDV